MPERHDHSVPVTFTRTPRSTAELVPHQPDDVKTWLKEITLNDAIVHLYTKNIKMSPKSAPALKRLENISKSRIPLSTSILRFLLTANLNETMGGVVSCDAQYRHFEVHEGGGQPPELYRLTAVGMVSVK
jgi:hypothetical protein